MLKSLQILLSACDHVIKRLSALRNFNFSDVEITLVRRRASTMFAQLGDGLNRLTAGRIRSPLKMQAFGTSAGEVSLDISKARNEPGYEPLVSLNLGLELMTR